MPTRLNEAVQECCARRAGPSRRAHRPRREDQSCGLRRQHRGRREPGRSGAADAVDPARRSGPRRSSSAASAMCRRDDTDYTADTLYGQSKVRTEQIVRSADGGGREWCLARPTTVWGPGMSAHYQRFLRMIERGYYFHVGHGPLWKSYSYIDNIAFQYWRLLAAPADQIQRRTFYLADYDADRPHRLVRRVSARVRLSRRFRICRLPLRAHAGALRRCRERGRDEEVSLQFIPPQQCAHAISIRPQADGCGLRRSAV